MKTTHQYIDKYPILKSSKKLIVGTIHPHNHNNFEIPFYYGNVTSLWRLLSDAFPEEMAKPISLKGVLTFLRNRKISVSDTIRKCERINPTALDKDLVPIELNTSMLEDIKKSEIDEIIFTSGFGKNNAFRLFYSGLLGHTITQEIRTNRGTTLDKSDFGRSIKLSVLYSPSGASNVGISKSKLYLRSKSKYKSSSRPVYDFKVDYYRSIFSN